MKASTHSGTCQCCGRVQRLPDDCLSLHGYTKQWGFFSGTCRGSRELPFEISKALVETFIESALQSIRHLEQEQTELLAPPTKETKAWCHVYVYDRRGHGSYEWQQGMVKRATRMIGGEEFKSLEWQGDTATRRDRHGREEPNVEKVSTFDLKENTPLAATASLNAGYVQRRIVPAIQNLNRYVAWQRERIKGWKPKALLPVTSAREDAAAEAVKELLAAGCEKRPYGWANTIVWWKGKRYLGRSAVKALALLKTLTKEA